MRGDPAAILGAARGSGLAPGRLSGRRAGERDGRRHRPVAPLPRGRRLAVALLARRPPGLGDADPRPPRLGARRPLSRHAGRGDLRRGRRDARARRAPFAPSGRLLRPHPAARRHPSGADHVRRDVGSPSTSSRTTPVASGATRTTRSRGKRGRSAPATSTSRATTVRTRRHTLTDLPAQAVCSLPRLYGVSFPHGSMPRR